MATGGGEQLGAAYISLGVDLTEFEANLSAARTKAAAFGSDVADAYTAGNTQAKSGITYLDRYIKMIGLGADEIQLLKAELRGVDSKTIDVARQRMEQLRAAAKALNDEQQKGANRAAFLKSLQDQATAVGKTKSEMLELKAAEMGVSAQAAPFIAKLREQESAMLGLAKATDKYGLSEKQRIAAMRQVPAQLTDIFVSLAGGQNPMMVMIQQGGQLKDVFGGIVPAARALGVALLGIVTNPVIIGLSAILGPLAIMAKAMNDSSKSAATLTQALALTGDYSGITMTAMLQAANASSQAAGGFDKATDALGKVASTGRFTADQITLVAEASAAMAYATGKDVDSMVQDFVRLADSPAKAILALNEKYHFLTQATYDQIRALEEQGRIEEATRIAIIASANAMNSRAADVAANADWMTRKAREVGKAWRDAWQEVANLINSKFDDNEQTRNVAKQQALRSRLLNLGRDYELNKNTDSDAQLAYRARQQREAVAALKAVNAEIEKSGQAKTRTNAVDTQHQMRVEAHESLMATYGDKEAKRETERRKVRAAGVAAGLSELQIQKDLLVVQAKFDAEDKKKESKGGGGKVRSLERAAAKADLQAFRDDLLREQALINNSTRLLQAQFQARRVSAEDYYTQTRALMERDNKAQIAALEGQIKALRERNLGGKDGIDIARQIGQLEAQLVKVRADSATGLEILAIQEEEVTRARVNAMAQYREALDQTTRAMREQTELQTASLYMSAREAEKHGKLAQVYSWQREELKKLNDEYARSNKTKDDRRKLEEGTRDVERAARERENIVNSGYDSMSAAQGDWVAGMKRGMKDWVDENSNLNEQSAASTKRTLDAMTTALTDFVMTGKMQWKELLTAILKEIVSFLVKKAVVSFVQMFMGGGASTGTGTGGVAMNYNMASQPTYAAMGGVFPGASGLSAYSGQIVSQPTPFYFAKGAALGVMGEAGSEAVMPLKRTSSGELGVMATGSGGVVVYQSFTFHSDGSMSSETTGSNDAMMRVVGARMQQVAKTAVIGMMRPGGELYKAGVRAG